jgi:TatD DNase family protein
LDAHAHLAPDVTQEQLHRLDGAHVIAMTRSMAEAAYVRGREDEAVTWGCGVHPTDRRALAAFDPDRFGKLIADFAVVGEVGLDFRGGERQVDVLRRILRIAKDEPVLMSIHSTGMVAQVLELLTAIPQRAPILHWFVGDRDQLSAAVGVGCFFSVNGSMTDEQIAALPPDRVLPETDYPAASRSGASKPGDIGALELRLSKLWGDGNVQTRHRVFANLRRLAVASGAIERLHDSFVEHLLAA